ncbi:MAG: RNA methyltransferase [Bacteroidales bacterium]|nr:RNA methyltransferase [Bacteroidales bacterium]
MAHKLTTDEMHRLSIDEFHQSEKTPLTVVIDNVRSLNNIGSIFRTADAFRIEQIVLCGICSTPPHREIHKTALGAEQSVDWVYFEQTTDCLCTLKSKGYKIYAIEQVDNSIKLGSQEFALHFGNKIKTPIAIVLGNEVDGVQDEVLPLCDGALEIPQYGTKHSLNVSCAAAIIMWELFKILQR